MTQDQVDKSVQLITNQSLYGNPVVAYSLSPLGPEADGDVLLQVISEESGRKVRTEYQIDGNGNFDPETEEVTVVLSHGDWIPA